MSELGWILGLSLAFYGGHELAGGTGLVFASLCIALGFAGGWHGTPRENGGRDDSMG